MANADEILAQQQRLAKSAAELANYTDDPKKLMEKAAELTKGAEALEKSALRFQQEMSKSGGKEEVVVLTPDQRARLAESTGVAMETLVVRDADGSFARAMPATQKATIERMAALQAGQLATKKGRTKALEDLVKQLKALDADGLDPVIKAIEEDPSLEKLKEQQAELAKSAGAPGDGG
jgi:hypothetical protein